MKNQDNYRSLQYSQRSRWLCFSVLEYKEKIMRDLSPVASGRSPDWFEREIGKKWGFKGGYKIG
jgi:hypothetical protein